MPRRPATTLTTRPLHFFWICDCSGSMSLNGKIQSLNNAVREALPEMKRIADDNPNADVMMRTLCFSHGAKWHDPSATRLSNFKWTDLEADPLQTPTVDVVFMIDTSGSMGDEIEAVKKSCYDFANRIIEQGANVRLGLIGFSIGGHGGSHQNNYRVCTLSTYTIGIWPITDPSAFQYNVQSLSLGLFGGGGCYVANPDTLDIFPYVVETFDGPSGHSRVLIIISDEIGSNEGVSSIVSQMKAAKITTHVLGVPGKSGAHEAIASQTGGQFWDIDRSQGAQDFSSLLDTVADAIAKEATRRLADGSVSAGTDMGAAMKLVSEQLQVPPMTDRALPPVLILISDGQPTDDFRVGLQHLMSQPWGKKAVRLAIGIGQDAEIEPLQKFIGNPEIQPFQANNPESLTRFIRFCSTSAVRVATAPTVGSGSNTVDMFSREIPRVDTAFSNDVW